MAWQMIDELSAENAELPCICSLCNLTPIALTDFFRHDILEFILLTAHVTAHMLQLNQFLCIFNTHKKDLCVMLNRDEADE